MNDFELTIDGTTYSVQLDDTDPATPDQVRVTVDGTSYDVRCEGLTALPGAAPLAALPPTPRRAPAAAAGGAGQVCAPMPGTVVSVAVEPGATVAAGDTLVMLEAMKMESPIPAPSAGTVAAVLVVAGQRVNTGEPLVALRTSSP